MVVAYFSFHFSHSLLCHPMEYVGHYIFALWFLSFFLLFFIPA